MLYFLLAALLVVGGRAQIRPIIEGCYFTSPDLRHSFDLREYYYAMADQPADFTGTLNDQFNFYLAICGTTNTPDLVGCTGNAAVCGYNNSDSSYINTLGAWSGAGSQADWGLLDEADASKGVKFTFNNGKFLDTNEFVTVTVNMPCDPNTTDISQTMVITETHMMDSFVMELKGTSHACPYVLPIIVIKPEDTPLSAGTVFLTFFFVGGFFYLVIGTLYKTMNMGTTGAESIPNIDFWRSLPDLVKDGCTATLAKLRGGGRAAGYDNVA